MIQRKFCKPWKQSRSPCAYIQFMPHLTFLSFRLIPFVQLGAHFLAERGLHVIVDEASRASALASTLILVTDILRLFSRSHVDAVYRAPIARAIGSMLTYTTKRGADERQVDVDVKLAALQLVQLLHTEGEPLAGVCGRAGAAEVRNIPFFCVP